jgi:hypothetical protein
METVESIIPHDKSDPIDVRHTITPQPKPDARQAQERQSFAESGPFGKLRTCFGGGGKSSPREIGAAGISGGKSRFSFTGKPFLGIIWPQIMD